jgi:pyruvate dehydrogenase E1 component alpha subunit
MTKPTSFEIDYIQYLDKDAKPANDLPEFAKDVEVMKQLYRKMQFLRTLDAKAIAMQRVGKMRTYPGSYGQEAVSIGSGNCLTEKDVLVPYYRGTGTMLEKGVAPHKILMYWGGDERGTSEDDNACAEDFPIAVPIATQILHAAGVASAIKLRGQKGRAVLTEIGEGGTSEGEFYEGMNVAGAWQLPLVCVINNNQWAISVRPDEQTSCETFAQKGIGTGVDCVQVDGNDIIAVKETVGKALDKARNGGGPTLVECITYRLCDHTTADDATRYHDQEQHDAALKIEPMVRLKKYIVKLGGEEAELDAYAGECKAEVEKAVETFYDVTQNQPQAPETIFDHLFETLPEKTRPQRDHLLAKGRN